MRSLRERVRARFRVACVPKSLFRQSQRQTGVGWRATATGLVVARVFQGNIVLARVAKSMAQNEWQRRMRRLGNLLPDFRIFAGSVSTASVAQSQASCSDVLVTSLDSRNSNSKLQAEYGDYEVSLSLYGGLPNYEGVYLWIKKSLHRRAGFVPCRLSFVLLGILMTRRCGCFYLNFRLLQLQGSHYRILNWERLHSCLSHRLPLSRLS